MKLFEVSSHATRSRFVSVVGGLLPELHAIAGSLEKMVDDGHGDIVRRHLFSRLARWCSLHFPTLISAAGALRDTHPAFKRIASVGVSAFTASSGQTALTKGNAFQQMWPDILIVLEQTGHAELRDKLALAMKKCYDVLEAGKLEQRDAADFQQKKQPNNDLPGKQADAVEKIVNAAIQSLPADLQHQARQVVSKADNKITALQRFMSQHIK